MIETVQELLNAWSVPFYAGWSIMRIFGVLVILTVLGVLLNSLLDKSGS